PAIRELQRVHRDGAFSREMKADARGGLLRRASKLRHERAARGDVEFADIALEVKFGRGGALKGAGGLVAIDERDEVGDGRGGLGCWRVFLTGGSALFVD